MLRAAAALGVSGRGDRGKQLDTWLSTVTPVRFIHIIKKTEKRYKSNSVLYLMVNVMN